MKINIEKANLKCRNVTLRIIVDKEDLHRNRHGRVPYRDSVGNRVLVHLTVLLYRLGVGLTLN